MAFINADWRDFQNTPAKNETRVNSILINELKQINQNDFLSCRNFGRKRLREFQTAIRELSKNNERAVTVLNEPSIHTIVVEIDLSKSFKEVIKDLHEIMERIV